MLFALLALAAGAQAGAAAAYPDPVAPAASHQQQCYEPSDHKTCFSLAGYVANGDGAFTSVATVLLSTDPLVVMRTITQVTVKDGAICGTVRPADITGGTLIVDGQPLTEDQAAPLLKRVASHLDGIIGHETCTQFVPADDGFTATRTRDGVPLMDQDQKVIWVAPADGYTVGP